MASNGIAKRYAEAIFDLASENRTHDEWIQNLEKLAEAADDPDAGAFFENPAVEEGRKEQALQAILDGPGNELAHNLTMLLIQRQRFEELPAIYQTFVELVLEERGIAIAQVTTAVELSAREQQQISQGLQKLMGRDIEVRASIDEAIIGGLIARVGDQLIDGSVRSQLRTMRTSLTRR